MAVSFRVSTITQPPPSATSFIAPKLAHTHGFAYHKLSRIGNPKPSSIDGNTVNVQRRYSASRSWSDTCCKYRIFGNCFVARVISGETSGCKLPARNSCQSVLGYFTQKD